MLFALGECLGLLGGSMKPEELEVLVRNISETLQPDLHESGAVFYSGPQAMLNAASYYLMGLNPGGVPDGVLKTETIQKSLEKWKDSIITGDSWSEYIHGNWGQDEKSAKAGKSQHQLNVRYLCESILQCNTESVFSANAIFRRGDPGKFGTEVLSRCRTVHMYLLRAMRPKVLFCLGNDAHSAFEIVKRWFAESPEVKHDVEECGSKGGRRVLLKWFDSSSSISALAGYKPARVIGLPHPSWHRYEMLLGLKEKVVKLLAEIE